MKICERCGAEHQTRSDRFCSRKCMSASRPSRMLKPTEVTCPICKRTRIIKLASGLRGRERRCRECVSDIHSGQGNARWRGGHAHWSPGRFGKDAGGRSWVAQRRLAWERDNYTCQHCHERKNRNPDVHHIDPWMNSHSHALDNLICLCQKCHMKLEATIQEKWGGQRCENGTLHLKVRPSCKVCGRKPINLRDEMCWTCHTEHLQRQAKELRGMGLTLR